MLLLLLLLLLEASVKFVQFCWAPTEGEQSAAFQQSGGNLVSRELARPNHLLVKCGPRPALPLRQHW